MTASVFVGLRSAARHLKLLWLLWAWFGLLALVPAYPAWVWWAGVLGKSPESASILNRFDIGVLVDVVAGKGISGVGLLNGAAAAAGLIALLSSAFAFGGMLEILGRGDDRRTFMHRFFRGGGHFFWRFFRLAIIAGVCVVVATGLVAAAQAGMNAISSESEWEPAGFLAAAASVVLFLVVAGLFLLALDYARIRVARDDSRSMLRAYAAAVAFVLRRAPAAYGIAVAILMIEVAIMAAYLAYETIAPAAGNWGAIAVMFLAQQVVVVGRVFVRVALVGAERHFCETALPQPAPVAAVVAEASAPVDAFVTAGPAADSNSEDDRVSI